MVRGRGSLYPIVDGGTVLCVRVNERSRRYDFVLVLGVTDVLCIV